MISIPCGKFEDSGDLHPGEQERVVVGMSGTWGGVGYIVFEQLKGAHVHGGLNLSNP